LFVLVIFHTFEFLIFSKVIHDKVISTEAEKGHGADVAFSGYSASYR